MANKPYSVACSFCDKGPNDVRILIAGPKPTAICDECVSLCSDIVAEKRAEEVIWKRMQERDQVMISTADAERLAWMKTWTTAAPTEGERRG